MQLLNIKCTVSNDVDIGYVIDEQTYVNRMKKMKIMQTIS